MRSPSENDTGRGLQGIEPWHGENSPKIIGHYLRALSCFWADAGQVGTALKPNLMLVWVLGPAPVARGLVDANGFYYPDLELITRSRANFQEVLDGERRSRVQAQDRQKLYRR